MSCQRRGDSGTARESHETKEEKRAQARTLEISKEEEGATSPEKSPESTMFTRTQIAGGTQSLVKKWLESLVYGGSMSV